MVFSAAVEVVVLFVVAGLFEHVDDVYYNFVLKFSISNNE